MPITVGQLVVKFTGDNADLLAAAKQSEEAVQSSSGKIGQAAEPVNKLTQAHRENVQAQNLFSNSMRGIVDQVLPGFGSQINQGAQAVGVLNGQLDLSTTKIAAVGGVLSALGIGGALAAARGFANLSDEIHQVEIVSGLSTRTIQGMMVAIQSAGGDSQGAGQALLFLNRNIQLLREQEAAGTATTSGLGAVLKQLGIDTRTFLELDADRQLKVLLDGLSGVKEKGEQAGLGAQAFGRGVRGVMDVIAGGSSVIEDGAQRVEKMGASMEGTRASVVRWHQAQADAGLAMAAFNREVGSPALETLTGIVEGLATGFARLPAPVRDAAVAIPIVVGSALLLGAATTTLITRTATWAAGIAGTIGLLNAQATAARETAAAEEQLAAAQGAAAGSGEAAAGLGIAGGLTAAAGPIGAVVSLLTVGVGAVMAFKAATDSEGSSQRDATQATQAHTSAIQSQLQAIQQSGGSSALQKQVAKDTRDQAQADANATLAEIDKVRAAIRAMGGDKAVATFGPANIEKVGGPLADLLKQIDSLQQKWRGQTQAATDAQAAYEAIAVAEEHAADGAAKVAASQYDDAVKIGGLTPIYAANAQMLEDLKGIVDQAGTSRERLSILDREAADAAKYLNSTQEQQARTDEKLNELAQSRNAPLAAWARQQQELNAIYKALGVSAAEAAIGEEKRLNVLKEAGAQLPADIAKLNELTTALKLGTSAKTGDIGLSSSILDVDKFESVIQRARSSYQEYAVTQSALSQAEGIAGQSEEQRAQSILQLDQAIKLSTGSEQQYLQLIRDLIPGVQSMGAAAAQAALDDAKLAAEWDLATKNGGNLNTQVGVIIESLGKTGAAATDLQGKLQHLFDDPSKDEQKLQAGISGLTAEQSKLNAQFANSDPMYGYVRDLVARQDQEGKTSTTIAQRRQTEEDLQQALARIPEAERATVLSSAQRIVAIGNQITASKANQTALADERKSMGDQVTAMSSSAKSIDQMRDAYEKLADAISKRSSSMAQDIGKVTGALDTMAGAMSAASSHGEAGGGGGSGGAQSGPVDASYTQPYRGRPGVTQPYGPSDNPLEPAYGGYAHFHEGIDYALPEGSPALAVGSGKVVKAGYGVVSQGQGNSIVIDLGGGFQAIYSHLEKIEVNTGDMVKQGQEVGLTGNTGTASEGPHLHFAVTLNGEPVDPSVLASSKPVATVNVATTPPSTADATANGPGYRAAQGAGASPAAASYPVPSGGKLTPEQMAQGLAAAGMPISDIATMVAIFLAENGGGTTPSSNSAGASGFAQLTAGFGGISERNRLSDSPAAIQAQFEAIVRGYLDSGGISAWDRIGNTGGRGRNGPWDPYFATGNPASGPPIYINPNTGRAEEFYAGPGQGSYRNFLAQGQAAAAALGGAGGSSSGPGGGDPGAPGGFGGGLTGGGQVPATLGLSDTERLQQVRQLDDQILSIEKEIKDVRAKAPGGDPFANVTRQDAESLEALANKSRDAYVSSLQAQRSALTQLQTDLDNHADERVAQDQDMANSATDAATRAKNAYSDAAQKSQEAWDRFYGNALKQAQLLAQGIQTGIDAMHGLEGPGSTANDITPDNISQGQVNTYQARYDQARDAAAGAHIQRTEAEQRLSSAQLAAGQSQGKTPEQIASDQRELTDATTNFNIVTANTSAAINAETAAFSKLDTAQRALVTQQQQLTQMDRDGLQEAVRNANKRISEGTAITSAQEAQIQTRLAQMRKEGATEQQLIEAEHQMRAGFISQDVADGQAKVNALAAQGAQELADYTQTQQNMSIATQLRQDAVGRYNADLAAARVARANGDEEEAQRLETLAAGEYTYIGSLDDYTRRMLDRQRQTQEAIRQTTTELGRAGQASETSAQKEDARHQQQQAQQGAQGSQGAAKTSAGSAQQSSLALGGGGGTYKGAGLSIGTAIDPVSGNVVGGGKTEDDPRLYASQNENTAAQAMFMAELVKFDEDIRKLAKEQHVTNVNVFQDGQVTARAVSRDYGRRRTLNMTVH